MTMKAPMNGLVSVKENTEGQMFMVGGMSVPEYKEGDLTSPGRVIVEILEVTTMEMVARVPETETGNLKTGQTVEVRVDAQPGRIYTGFVKTIAGTAASTGPMASAGPVRKFDVVVELKNLEATLRPGVTAQVVIKGESVKNALLLPRSALFEKDGKPIVYEKQGDQFIPREVKVSFRTESRAAVEGLNENADVALVNPEGPGKAPGKAEEPAGPVMPKTPTGKGSRP
jgi:membrane fusion protein (multidrug efflux system)